MTYADNSPSSTAPPENSFQVTRSAPQSNVRRMTSSFREKLSLERDEFKKTSASRDPYACIIPITTKPNPKLPFIDINGSIEAQEDQEPATSQPPEVFEGCSEFRALALYNTGSETCFICDDIVGVRLNEGVR